MPQILILRAGLPVLIALVAAAEAVKAAPATATPPARPFAEGGALALPIDCTPGRDCWLPNYVDADPGKGARDYAGGVRTYNGHRGVDFAIRDRRAMARGVPVRAAAAGVVLATRDAMADMDYKLLKAAAIKGRECGNAVVVRHGADWRTQYCHMRKGSIAVVKGQRIKSGARLGLVGLSGKTEFPHLHFMVFYKGQPVDPFTGARMKDGYRAAKNMWRVAAAAVLGYRESNIYHAGFSHVPPRFEAARRGDYQSARLASPLKMLFVWMDVFGVHNDDKVVVRLIGPGERLVAERRLTMKLKRPRAREFLHFQFKHEQRAWPAGAYRSEMILTRQASGGIKSYRASRRVTID